MPVKVAFGVGVRVGEDVELLVAVGDAVLVFVFVTVAVEMSEAVRLGV